VQVRLSDTQDNLPGDSDSVEEVVDEAHVVDEGVHVAGAQHEQGGQALRRKKERKFDGFVRSFFIGVFLSRADPIKGVYSR